MYWDKWDSGGEAMAGRYSVSLYTDGAQIGESFFELK
jgi:hypothetical protein